MTTADTQDAMLARIRAALGRSRTPPAPPAPRVDETIVRQAGFGDDLVNLFTRNATALGMTVQHLRSDQLIRQVLALLSAVGAKSVVTGVGSLPQAIGLNDAIRRKGLAVLDWRALGGLDTQFAVDVGITDVHAAIAEPGVLVCLVDAGHSRGLSLIPPVHVAIVRKSDILPDLIDYWARRRIAAAPLPASITFIAGPSKTADIEGMLVTGVHGPGRVEVLLVEDV